MVRLIAVAAILALFLISCTRSAPTRPAKPTQVYVPPPAGTTSTPASSSPVTVSPQAGSPAAAAVPQPASQPAVTPPAANQPAATPPAAAGPADPPPEYREALALIGSGNYFAAEAKLKEVVARYGNLAEAWNDLAFVRIKNLNSTYAPRPELPGRGSKENPAADAARKALELRPGFAFAQYNLGVALLAKGQYAGAVQPLQESGRQQPDRAEPLVALGLALMGVGRYDDAAAACRQARALEPGHKLAAACLDEIGDGAVRLPATEAAIGSFRWEPVRSTFVWTGDPAQAPVRQVMRISPPWACGDEYTNGFRTYYVGCGAGSWYYMWGASSEAAGKTPSGLGVGTTMAELVRTYGITRQSDNQLIYLAGDLQLVFQLNEQNRISWFHFGTRSPYFLIDSLLRS